jgi:tetratricopeptide (TPR) repeat protein
LLVINRSESPLSILARYRLAQLDSRDGDIESALAYLDTIKELVSGQDDLQGDFDFGNGGSRSIPMLKPAPTEATLHYPFESTIADAENLRHFIQENHPDPVYREEPLKLLLSFDPADAMYQRNLAMLLDRFPLCKLSDNIKLLRAKLAETARERLELLKDVTTTHPNGDAVPEALYLLGSGLLDVDRRAEARDVFDRLIREFPDSFWRKEADQRLRHWPARLAGA